MKSEKWISAAIATAIAFLLSFGAVGCMLSGFDLDVQMGTIALGCGLLSVFGGACYLHRRGDALAACAVALILGYLWRRGTLVSSFETLVYEISRRYDGGYGWGVLGQQRGSVTTAALILGGDIALSAARTVCHRNSAFPAITIALLPLLLCVVVTDTVPGEGCLGCLLMGMLLLIMTQSLRRNDPAQANTLTAGLAIPLALGLGILFWAVPQQGYVNQTEQWRQGLTAMAEGIPALWEALSGEENTVTSGDTESQSVDLTRQGPKKQYSYTVMTVTAPATGSLYLRGRDYDSYTGTGWESTRGRRELFLPSGESDLDWSYVGNVEISTRRVKDNLYYPYYTGKGLFLLEGGYVDNTDDVAVYSLSQYALPPGWEANLASLPEQSVSGLARYRKLPEQTRVWAEELVNTILSGERTDTEIARTIGEYVKNSATYDLNTPKMDPGYEDFAHWFLTESDTGYCVHYATAATVLLRAAGVEARYVTGYMVWAQAGQQVTVTAERAHAWVEYYESRLGVWMVLEATAGVSAATEPDGEETVISQTPAETDPGQTQQTTSRPPDREEPSGTQNGEDTPADDGGRESGPSVGWQWLLLLLLPGGAVGQYALRKALRRRSLRRKTSNQRLLMMWQEAVLLGKLLNSPPPGQLKALAQKARFSQHTISTQELMLFDSWLREERSRFRSRPWYWKLLMRVLYAI